ncbi:MAG: hypothetical protein GY925_13405, partial [Actinomycetia bacterium]|nr:hypothetical protein [Actinomycetes bacterium]
MTDQDRTTDLTLDEIQTRRAEIRDELLPLAEAETLDTDQTTQFRSLSEEWGLLDTAETAALAARADIQERQAAQAAALNDWKPRPGNISSPTDGFVAPTGVAQTSTSDPWDRDVLQRT